MNATQSAEIRRRLLEEREHLLDEWSRHGGDAVAGEDWDLRDPEERATQITSGTVDMRIAEDNLNLLRKVELALQRMNEGVYQTCANCGNEIPIERLMAEPSVSLCLACQEEKDASES